MVVDKVTNGKLYYSMGKNIEKALKWLEENKDSLINKEPGRYEIDGNEIFYILKHYETRPAKDCKLENHHIYADIQYVVKGKEWFGYAPTDTCTQIEAHPENDAYFFKGEDDPITLGNGLFALVLPDDAHRPDCAVNGVSESNIKCIIKVKVQ